VQTNGGKHWTLRRSTQENSRNRKESETGNPLKEKKCVLHFCNVPTIRRLNSSINKTPLELSNRSPDEDAQYNNQSIHGPFREAQQLSQSEAAATR